MYVRTAHYIDNCCIFYKNVIKYRSGKEIGGEDRNKAHNPAPANGQAAPGTFPEPVATALQHQIAKPIINAILQDAGANHELISAGVTKAR